MTDGLFLDGKAYVLNLDAALNFPEILDISQNAPICNCLIVPIDVYDRKLRIWEDEDNDRAFVAIELAKFLMNITDRSEIKGEEGKLYFEYSYEDGKKIILDPRNHDGDSPSSSTHTIACAKHWNAAIITSKPTLVTDAKTKGVDAYFLSPNIYTGYRKVEISAADSLRWEKRNSITAADWENNFSQDPLMANEFVEFVYRDGAKPSNYSNVGMFNPQTNELEHLKYFNCSRVPKNIYPRNARQAMAFEAAYADLDRKLTCVIFYGAAGCGKTFISLGAAIAQTDIRASFTNREKLEQVYQGNYTKRRKKQKYAESGGEERDEAEERSDRAIYSQIWCCPPDRMMGDKLGAVPGNRWEKLRDNLDGYCQNIQAFLAAQRNKKKGGEEMSSRDIEIKAEGLMRSIHFTSAGQLNGDSFSDVIFLLDEAEFMKESQIRTAIERIAERARIIICGDPTQIRNPYGWYGNSLARVIRRLAGDQEVAILKFEGDLSQRDGAGIIHRNYCKTTM